MEDTTIRDVMVFTPIWRLEPEAVDAILCLEWHGPITFVFQEDNPGQDGKQNHLNQFQRGRKTFLDGTYDAMLVVESDIIVPEDALFKLVELGADVNYGVYRFRANNLVNVFIRYDESGEPKPVNVGESLSVRPELLKEAVKEIRIPCSGGGLGCVLIRRKVLEKVDFRMERSNGAHADTFFTRDVFRAGFTMKADMSVVCGHKDENGKILWPDLKVK